MTRDEILKKTKQNRETISGFGVRCLGIFGSYARGKEKEASDMDFLVEFDDATLQKCPDLKEFLEKLFHRRVDVVFANAIKSRLRSTILEETVCAQGF